VTDLSPDVEARLEDLLVEHGGFQTHETRASMARVLNREQVPPPAPARRWTPWVVNAALVELGAAKPPKLAPDPAFLKRMIELYNSGLRMVEIAAAIEAEGFRRFDGRPFTWQSVNALLRTRGILVKHETAESSAYCSCGCGTPLGPDSRGRPRMFVRGHNKRRGVRVPQR
jgi:hypothetical protein